MNTHHLPSHTRITTTILFSLTSYAKANCTTLTNSNNQPKIFSSCHSLHTLPPTSSLQIYWTILSSTQVSNPSGNITVEIALLSNMTMHRRVALGFPITPGSMIGATAVVLCNTIQPQTTQSWPFCSSSSFKTLYLGGKTPQDITSPGSLLIINSSSLYTSINKNNNGSTPVSPTNAPAAVTGAIAPSTALSLHQALFTISLPAPPNLTLPIIYATGPLDPSTAAIQIHDMRDAALLDLTTGQSSHQSTDDSSIRAKKNAHAWLMAVGWTLSTLGGVVARSFRVVGGFWWFQIHQSLQLLGISCIIAAFSVIFSALGGHRTTYHVHFNIGISFVFFFVHNTPSRRSSSSLYCFRHVVFFKNILLL